MGFSVLLETLVERHVTAVLKPNHSCWFKTKALQLPPGAGAFPFPNHAVSASAHNINFAAYATLQHSESIGIVENNTS